MPVVGLDESAASLTDAGFVEWGFCYNIAHKVRAKFLKLCPFLIKTTHIFDQFGEKLLALPVNRSIFDPDFS